MDVSKKRPSLDETNRMIRVNPDRKQSHGLHLSVNFSSQGWRQSLDPLEKQPKSSLEELARKNTYTLEHPSDFIEFHETRRSSLQLMESEEDDPTLMEH